MTTVSTPASSSAHVVVANRNNGLRRLLPWLRPYAGRIIVSFVLVLASNAVQLVIPQILRVVVDGPAKHHDIRGIVNWAIVVFALGVFATLCWVLRRMAIIGPSMQVERSLRVTLFDKLQRLPVAFHDDWDSGQLLSRSSTDLSAIRRWMLFPSTVLLMSIAMIGIGYSMLVATQPVLGVVYIVLSLPAAYVSYRFEQQYSGLAQRSQQQVGDLATSVEQSVHGIRVLKAFGRGEDALRSFRFRVGELRDTEYRKADALTQVWVWLTLIPQMALAAVLAISIWQVAVGGLTAGEATAFFLTAAALTWPIESLGFLYSSWVDAHNACARVFTMMDEPDTLPEPEHPVEPTTREGRLAFHGVHYRHADVAEGGDELFAGVDLDVRPGETMALVGLTGSGKSILTELVPRLRDVDSGSILIDGVDVRDMSKAALRQRVSTAFEEPTLFSLSVRDNVAMGDPDASDEAIQHALDIAQATFVDDLPEGMYTLIGEEGHSLSGGQRQRLALARAIVGRPEFLVLDDPLSALDVSTEELVERGLRAELEGVTTLVVAHRPSTVALADRVALLHKGKIVAVGTHEELLQTSDLYRMVIADLDAQQPTAGAANDTTGTPDATDASDLAGKDGE